MNYTVRLAMQDVNDIDPANVIKAKEFLDVGYYHSFCCEDSVKFFFRFSTPTKGTHASFRPSS